MIATPSPRCFEVMTPDRLRIQAREWGTEDGAELLFIHGFSQAGLCWRRQTQAPELAHLRMVDYDFRGHGGSDKPLDPAFYHPPERWADELAAVISQAKLRKPVLVGWSYAGRVICDYLSIHGAEKLGGIVFVNAVTRNEKHFYGSSNRLMRQMCATDLDENIAGTRAFLRNCFEIMPDQDAFEQLLAANMMVPPQVRAALFGRPADFDAMLAQLNLPVTVVQGDRDIVVAPAMAHHIANSIPGARLEMFENIGHAPFMEAPGAFNRMLLDFLGAVQR